MKIIHKKQEDETRAQKAKEIEELKTAHANQLLEFAGIIEKMKEVTYAENQANKLQILELQQKNASDLAKNNLQSTEIDNQRELVINLEKEVRMLKADVSDKEGIKNENSHELQSEIA